MFADLPTKSADARERINWACANACTNKINNAKDSQYPSRHIVADVIRVNKTNVDERCPDQNTHYDIDIVKIAFYSHEHVFPYGHLCARYMN